MDNDWFVAVVAIDFGTTYTGYAYTFRSEYEKSKETREIYTNRWSSGLAGNLSKKAPTVALFNSKYEFDSFGYAAEEKYADLTEHKKHKDWHFFRRFKMQLYDCMVLDNDFQVEDQLGTKYAAKVVFRESIKYIKQQALDELLGRNPVEDNAVLWVLTVPAIWNEAAKNFMRKAAIDAGIKGDKLRLALEPEAAAIFCKTLPSRSFANIKDEEIKRHFEHGGRYMLLDMGGGTVDIAVHEITKEGRLIEILPAVGGNWGGTCVDQAFQDYIENKIGADDAQRLIHEKTSHWLKLENNFECTKRRLKFKTDNDLRLDIPPVIITESNLSRDFTSSFKLNIPCETFRDFFYNSVQGIIRTVNDILKSVGDVTLLLMVGGYAQSDYVYERIKVEFPSLLVLAPPQAEVAVMNGAVMFGFEPSFISARMSRHTYGIGCFRQFESGLHPEKARFVVDGEELCADVFSKCVAKGDILRIDEKRKMAFSSSHKADNRQFMEMSVPLFVSTIPDPKFTTDEECQQIGNIVVAPPKNGWPKNVKYSVEIFFGRTEFEVKVVNDSGESENSAKYDFLIERDVAKN